MAQLIDGAFGGDRTSTGLEDLDSLIEGGYPANRAVLVCGPPGSGKTILGLQFLMAGIERGEPGAFVAVDQKPRHILEDARRLGWDLQSAMGRSRLALLDASPFFTVTRRNSWNGSGVDARQVATDVVREIRRAGARRLVIDSVTSLVSPDLTAGETYAYLRSLVQSLEDNLGCTILLTCQGSRHDAQHSCRAARHLASGILELQAARRGAALARSLCIRKMRGTRIEVAYHPLVIEKGIGLSLRAEPTTVDNSSRHAAHNRSVERARMVVQTAVATG